MTLEQLLEMLKGVRKNGTNYLAQCPSHQDGSPSLSVKQGKQWLLLHCFAGCTLEEICDGLGIDVKDLGLDPLPARERASWYDLETLDHPRRLNQRRLESAVFFVDLHRPRPRGLERIKMIQAVLRRLEGEFSRGERPHA